MGKHLAHPTNLIGVAEVYFIPFCLRFVSTHRSEPRANPERRHAVPDVYYNYTQKAKNQGAAFEIKIATVNGSR